jgi:purine-nucleoside phosphorylase
MENYFETVQKAAQYIQDIIKEKPQIGIILGSGLGPLADEIENSIEIDYKDIPGFPVSTVIGHAGKLVFGTLEGKKVLAMKGRFHYYEGYDPKQVTLPVRVMKLLGIDNLLVTNAAGGINRDFSTGALMLIKDHISFFVPSSLRGENIDEFGIRFPDMSDAYSKELRAMAKEVAEEKGVEIFEGVYAFAQGPMYETPAEIRAFSIMGADAVGMSTVLEVMTASHASMNVLGISCITNMAAGILDQKLDHTQVMETAKRVEKGFVELAKGIIEKWSV